MREFWKNIEGFEGLYKCSNLGNIKSLARIKKMPTGGLHVLPEIILKQRLNKGYCIVNLGKDGIKHVCKVHQIICRSFKKNPLNKPEVNHKNGIKTDNRAINLEWSTKSENSKHAFKIGLNHSPACKGEANGMSKLKASQILDIRKSDKSLRVLAKEFSVSSTLIAKIKKGEAWKCVA